MSLAAELTLAPGVMLWRDGIPAHERTLWAMHQAAELRQRLVLSDHRFRGLESRFTVTACLDGKHSPKSLHRYGLAFDYRNFDLGVNKKLYHEELKKLLAPYGFDVVLETEPDHGHVEYDPNTYNY